MNIFTKLTTKSLILNKKRTIGTIVGIILSVALICAVAGMATSFQKTLVEITVKDIGNFHLKLNDITQNDVKQLENNRYIKKINAKYDIGYAKLEGSKNPDKPYLHLHSMNKEAFDDLSFNLIEGRFPQKDNEIIISKAIIENAKVNYKVGDKITLEVGQRQDLEGYSLGKYNPYHKEEETIANKEKKEYTIVGLMQRPTYTFEGSGEAGYTIITSQATSNKINSYIILKDPYHEKAAISNILGVEDYEKAALKQIKYDYEVNSELLRWEAFKFSDQTVQMFYSIIGIVIATIILTSVYCIKNAFAISTTEKIKMYGMLSSIGATKKQIKHSVIQEGMILAIIGIPLGILGGIFADYILILLMNQLLGKGLLGDEIVFYISIIPIIVSVVLGLVTIYLSVISAARKTSKITPMEAIRNTNEIKIGDKKLKTPYIIKKIFKTGGVIAYKNLKRSKKKYRTTVVSLVVSVFTFITMNSLLNYGFKSTGEYYKEYDYNMKLTTSASKAEKLNDIVKNEKLENYTMLYESTHNGNGYYTIKDKSKIKEETEEQGDIEIKALDEKSFKEYVKKLKLDYNKVKDKGILCDYYQYYEEGKIELRRIYNYEKNDTISGIYNQEKLEIPLAEITQTKPDGLENTFYSGGYLIVNIAEYKDLGFRPDILTIQANDPDQLETTITKKYPDISINNIAKDVEQQKTMILVISIFAYGFITVIALIGVTNIFNTITSNIELRQKEFATLKSIGMTKKEFNRMINLETLFYSSKALIWGILLGLLGTFGLYKAFYDKFHYEFILPVNAILISIITVFVLVFIIMRFSIKKVNRQNTIETIRKETI